MNLVHFILTGGELGPCEKRALISSIRLQGHVILWHTGNRPDTGLNIETRKVDIPEELQGIVPNRLCDVLRWKILYEHGGLFLGLDTISLRPPWNLLQDSEIVLSTDWPVNDPDVLISHEKVAFAFNDPILAKAGSPLLLTLYEETRKRAPENPNNWGYTGPYMLSDFFWKNPRQIHAAPYPTLCGWAPGYIWKFYLGLETPKPEVRIIHLFKSAYLSLYERRYRDFALQYPQYAGEVARRTDANERLLRCP